MIRVNAIHKNDKLKYAKVCIIIILESWHTLNVQWSESTITIPKITIEKFSEFKSSKLVYLSRLTLNMFVKSMLRVFDKIIQEISEVGLVHSILFQFDINDQIFSYIKG